MKEQRVNPGVYAVRWYRDSDWTIAKLGGFRNWRVLGSDQAIIPHEIGRRIIVDPLLIVLRREDDNIVADTPARPGMVPIGSGKDFYEALGRWLHGNRDLVGVKIDVDDSAWPDEVKRREKELADR